METHRITVARQLKSAGREVFPAPESEGGWSTLVSREEKRQFAHCDADALRAELERQQRLFPQERFGIVVVRDGYLVDEYYADGVSPSHCFDTWSCTKSFVAMAWGMLFDDIACNQKKGSPSITLDTPVYSLIETDLPLSDSRKALITLRHLLTMSSGIAGEDHGLFGVSTQPDVGPFEHALGFGLNTVGKSAATLVADPGMEWHYSDPAMAHLSLAFFAVAGCEMNQFVQQRLLQPIGIETAEWGTLGGGLFMGPHTNPMSGLRISARDMARFGYLLLRVGRWQSKCLISDHWLCEALRPSQSMNLSYGYAMWLNTNRTRWPALPSDAFALEGSMTNRCYVVPSLDLVVVRVGAGPAQWNEPDFITAIADAMEVTM
jgi:CubicO group peptidase (beta-lactamase class C family)